MSRKFDRSSLPPLTEVLQTSPAPDRNNLRHAIRELRELALKLRGKENLPFYSMRELSTQMGVPLRTIAIAIENLEAEGLLLRLRGSHTKLLGVNAQPLKPISGVIGMPVCIFGLRHFIYRRHLTRLLGDALWQKAISTDTILYWEYEDLDHEFIERLLRHRIDLNVWFQPLRQNLDAIAYLKDRGVRSVVIGDLEITNPAPDIAIDWQPAYERVLTCWKNERGIRRIVLVEGERNTAARGRFFEGIAATYGMKCSRRQSSPELAGEIARQTPLPADTAIALFDDHASTDFSLRDPDAFLNLADRHRILFARDVPSIPFAAAGSFSCERLAYPTKEIIDAVSSIVLARRSRTADPAPLRFAGLHTLDYRTPDWM